MGNQKIASYSNLSPGTYLFKVKAANNDGVWTDDHRTIRITVLPPWWFTWWFISSVLIFLSGLVITLIALRSRQIRANERKLKEKVAQAVADANQQKEQVILEKEKLQQAVAETNAVVNSTLNSGSFQERMTIEGKDGAWRDLAQSINTLFESIVHPFTLLNLIINKVSKGDLTPRIEESLRGESEIVANNLNLALDNLSAFIRDISNSIQHIEGASIDMNKATEEMNLITQEISSAIGEMNQGSKQQLDRVDQSFQLTEDIRSFSTDMGNLAASIHESAEKGASKSTRGKAIVGRQNQVINEIGLISKESVDSMRQLAKSSKEISSVIGIIKEIASQTNLLALNAAIEAAQAGDAGRGFAVVASEIRKLAEDSKKSAGMIEELITGIQSETNATARLMEKMEQQVKEGVATSGETSEALEEISALYQETVESAQQISEATRQQTLNLEGISSVLEEVVVISEQTAAGAEEIHSSAEKVSENMAHFYQKSRTNVEIAQTLRQQSTNFKLE